MIDTKALFREHWDAEVQKRLDESPSYALGDFTVTGRAPAPYGRRTLDWWQDKGHEMVDRYVEWRKETRWDIWEPEPGVPAIELEINFSLPGDIPVKTFIDRLFVTKVGELVLLDIKTGRTPETPEQLGLYACAVDALYGVRPAWGFWWDASKGTHSAPLSLDRYTPRYLAAVYEDAIRGINAGCFPAKPANNCKDWCSVSRFCAAVGGRDAASVDPLLSA